MSSVFIIMGPTASGKSSLALRYAQEKQSVIINADSMQVYRGLEILTAQPSSSDQSFCSHLLYGVVDPLHQMTAGQWIELALEAIKAAFSQNKRPILVGGTGLYLKSLLGGISSIPPIPSFLREESQKLIQEKGTQGLYETLKLLDPLMAEKLHPHDTQRLSRAWEVKKATGRSLYEWHQEAPKSSFPFPYEKILVTPEKNILEERIESRIKKMIEGGVLEEIQRFSELYPLERSISLHKALGYEIFLNHLRGGITLSQAIERTAQLTRQYAKRQMTWIRHQMKFL